MTARERRDEAPTRSGGGFAVGRGLRTGAGKERAPEKSMGRQGAFST